MTRVDPVTPCTRNVTPRSAGDRWSWRRADLPQGCSRGGERGQGSRGLRTVTMQQMSRNGSHSDAKNQAKAAGTPGCPGELGPQKAAPLFQRLCQSLQNPKPFPCTTASAGDAPAGKGELSSRGRRGGGGQQHPAFPRHPWGHCPVPCGGQSRCLCLALCVQQSSSGVGVNPRERLGLC